ncbi:DUF2452 domain-containing protein [Winogradskyella sp. UBA3174]|uniref:DUF2452 domain-containing protein n=1 Tax=Winogradskyella sp. UBA3174 TaxID=1947785 RepID=UPI0025CC3056|nr:DUF2452 domain-containing protein [Winogradskyella sp. UBA3174]|tara:strand:+ start:7562 stop:7963 length:402 start_codon:yes stop_codon:yes gene_type:complete
MKKDKKPDHVVYNTETERYDAFLKPYATSLSAPVITTTDSLAWKNRNINKVNKHVQAKYNELKTAYTEMMQQYEYNNLVYGARFNFEPIVGQIYHLYKRKDESIFLSIIAPEECNFNHVNSFYLDADGIWHKK